MRENSPERFAHVVLMAIGHGSSLTSPFLHASRDIQVARKWYKLGRERRRDQNYLVRIRRSKLPAGVELDLSTEEKQVVIAKASLSATGSAITITSL